MHPLDETVENTKTGTSGGAVPPTFQRLGKENLHKALRQMVLIRRFEEGA